MPTIPTTPPDLLAILLPIVRAAVPAGVNVGRKKDDSNKFVLVRADLQNPVTPLSRYARVGVTVWWEDPPGRARIGEAFDLSNTVVRAILEAKHPAILDADWQSGPAETNDPISGVEIMYSSILLEVTNDL